MAAPRLTIKTLEFFKKLGTAGNRIQIAAAEAINESAKSIEVEYQDRLKKNQTIRTPFTINAIKTFKATPISRGGEPRELSNINAIIGVRKMRGAKEHYLAKLEEGGTTKGNSKTKNRVPIPLDAARTGMSNNKPIAGINRLLTSDTQTLKVGGKNFGVEGDGYKSSKQRFAILYNYKKKGGNGLTGDVNKPFFFFDNSNKMGIFKFIRNQVRKIRGLDNTSVQRKRTDHFKKSVATVKPLDTQKRFVKIAERMVKGD